MNKRLLLGAMVAAGFTQTSTAKELNMAKNTFNSKVNGRGHFSTDDAIRLCDLYGITDAHAKVDIFLSRPSQ